MWYIGKLNMNYERKFKLQNTDFLEGGYWNLLDLACFLMLYNAARRMKEKVCAGKWKLNCIKDEYKFSLIRIYIVHIV